MILFPPGPMKLYYGFVLPGGSICWERNASANASVLIIVQIKYEFPVFFLVRIKFFKFPVVL